MSIKETEKLPEVEDSYDSLKQFEKEQHQLRIATGSHALAKACMDPFDYAMRIRTGEVLLFEQAVLLNSEWVHLTLKQRSDQPVGERRIAFKAERGVDVRLSDIVWVMDAPYGS